LTGLANRSGMADHVEQALHRLERTGEPFAVMSVGIQALDDVLVARGFGPPTYAANWYPSVEEFAAVYEQAGFKDVDARLIERPTELEHGVAAWVTTFRKGWLDRAGVPEDERQGIAEAVADRVGSNVADYVRLRFIMRKPA
jgi:hypothetical protein